MVLSRRPSEDKGRRMSAQSSEEALQAQRRNSQWDAKEFIEAFVREGWESYWSSITVTCEITLQELYNLGYLPRSQGTRECRKLLRAPVINDEIGTALWEKLATMVRGEDDSGNIDDPEVVRAWYQGQARERMRQEINFMRHHNKTGRRRSISPPPTPRHKYHHEEEENNSNCILCIPGQHHHVSSPTLVAPGHLSPSTAAPSHLSPSLAAPGSPEIQVVSPPLTIIRTEEPMTPEADPTAASGGHSRKLSWILPLPLPGRRRSSVATRLSAKSTGTSSNPASPRSGGSKWEEGFWQQKEKQEVRRAEPNKLFANVDRDTTPGSTAIAEILALATTVREVTPGYDGEEGQQQEREQNGEYELVDPLVDPLDTTTATHQYPNSITSSHTTSTTSTANTAASASGKETLSFPKRILRKLSGPHLLANLGEFGESLGAGYGSRDV